MSTPYKNHIELRCLTVLDECSANRSDCQSNLNGAGFRNRNEKVAHFRET